MQEFSQIESIIETMKVIISAMKASRAGDEDIANVRQTVWEVNAILYHCGTLKFMGQNNSLEKMEDYQKFVDETEKLIEIWQTSISRRKGLWIDAEFWEIYEFFKYVEPDVIYEAVKEYFKRLPEGLRIDFLALPHRYTFLKDRLDFTKDDYSLIRSHVNLMTGSVEKYKWLYTHLVDYRSKIVLNGIIKYWFQFNPNSLHALLENTFSDYYDLDILKCDEKDVMVDLGAYTGDSILNYIHTYGSYKKIYAYEITEKTFRVLEKNTSEFSDIVLRRKGVGSKSGTMYMDGSKTGAGNKILEKGDTEIEVVSLDDDISEPVSVIKMDIEGAEQSAIIGAREHIVREKPRLLISAYHNPEDLFEIPVMINFLREDYKFYLRFNGRGCLWPCDYVVFAV
ncbi:MAG: FkbM family methyltransferase [Roseburia sp.]|nr:FkbM family methyltransferase [Roseburia sp.]